MKKTTNKIKKEKKIKTKKINPFEMAVRFQMLAVHARLDDIIDNTEENGVKMGEIIRFLLEQDGYDFFKLNLKLTPEEVRKLGKHKVFEYRGVEYLIAKRDKVVGKKKVINKTK